MGVLDLNEKKNKEAAEVFRKAYETNPANSRGLLGESRALLLDGQTAKSVDLIRVESDKHPERQDLLRELGDVQMAARLYDDWIASYRKSCSQNYGCQAKGRCLGQDRAGASVQGRVTSKPSTLLKRRANPRPTTPS